MIDTRLAAKLGKALNVDKMSEAEKDRLFTRLGNIIMEGSINRLLADLNEAEIMQLQECLESADEAVDPFSYLLETYPQFEAIVEEEIAALQSDTDKVVG